MAEGGDLYVPTPDQKAAFKEGATPVFNWFKANVGRGDEILTAPTDAVAKAEAEAEVGAARAADLN